MRLYIDKADDSIIPRPNAKNQVRSIPYKRGTSKTIEVQFVEDGDIVELAEGATGKFGIKQLTKYDAPPIVFALTWTKFGIGADTYYTFLPDFNGAILNDLLGHDGIEGNDTGVIQGMLEIEWIEDGQKHKTPTVTAVIDNDIIKDSDFTPTPLPTPVGTTAPVNAAPGAVQWESMQAVGTISSSGDLAFSVISPWLNKSINVPVLAGDSQSVWAGKVKNAVAGDSELAEFFSPSTLTVADTWFRLTANIPAAAGDAFYFALANGTAAGITEGTSETIVPGVDPIPATLAPPYIRVAGGFLYVQDAGTWKKTALSAL